MPLLSARNGLLCVGLLSALPIWADNGQFPARFDVTGPPPVIRDAPSETADILADVRPERTGLQILAVTEDGLWGQTAFGAQSGWILMSSLTRQAAPNDQGLPLRCYGVEPFWGVHLPSPFFAEYERPEHLEVPFQITGTDDQIGPNGRTRLWTFAGETASATLLVRHEVCHDGMSDRPFGLSAFFTLMENTGAVHLRLGCCALTSP